MKSVLVAFLSAGAVALSAQTVNLPELTVYSPRVANQEPAGTFAMPVSALRYEPEVDVQARNLAEAQADITIRGGTFETTGFQVGAVTLVDPQTGHYFAEIPIAPAMLTAPEILTGAELAARVTNTNVGAVSYGWRPIRTAGTVSVGAGDYGLRRGEFYQGFASDARVGPVTVAGDIDVADSRSDGSVPFGESRFDRVAGRLQLRTANAQTDFFAGYQAKFFGWPNLYTPFNSDETENLETRLLAVNHRISLGGDDFFEIGAYDRRNKDDYAFDRFAPLGVLHPFQHTTWVRGLAVDGRSDLGPFALNYRGETLSDFLRSTSLTAGTYHSRVISKLALVPEKAWSVAGGGRFVVKAGGTYDNTDHGDSAYSPVAEVAREFAAGDLKRVYVSYARTTELPSYTALNSSATAGLFRGNPNLGRESSRNAEIGASGGIAGWTGQAALFYRRDDSLVDWTFARGVTARSANAVDVATTGFEAVARRSWSAVDLVFGYTVLTKDADYRGARVDASFYALNYARHRVTAAIVARLGHGFELRMDNVYRAQADNLLRVTGGNDAVISSLALAYRPAELKGFAVSVQVDNLWNSSFQDVPAVPAARRQFSGGVSYAW